MTTQTKNRKPVIRQNTRYYLLYTLLSFAASVSITRLFLEITGYPQIGGGELHIAHVLWGGLLLFIAALLPIIFANQWVYTLNAILAGVGIGLFIDEVGKFITKTNDYFYPSAAPIIYAFFLLVVLLYLQFKRKKDNDARTLLYEVLENLEEVLDRDLSKDELDAMTASLNGVIQETSDIGTVHLAQSLLEYLESDSVVLVEDTPPLYQRIQRFYINWERKWLSRQRFKAIILGGMTALGTWAVYYPLHIIFTLSRNDIYQIINDLINNRLVRNASGLNWFEARLGLEGSVGLVLLLAASLLIVGKDRRAIDLAYIALLLSLTVFNLILFYFDQFSTIVNSVVQFTLFVGLLRYRRVYLENRETLPELKE